MVAELAAAELPGSQGKGKPDRRRLIATWSERPRPTCVGAGLQGWTDSVPGFSPFRSAQGQIPTQASVTLATVK